MEGFERHFVKCLQKKGLVNILERVIEVLDLAQEHRGQRPPSALLILKALTAGEQVGQACTYYGSKHGA
jgi:hypothetical protein